MKGSTTLSAAAVAAAASKALPPAPSSLAPACAASGWAAATMPWSEVMLGRLPCMVPTRSACRRKRRVGYDRFQCRRRDAHQACQLRSWSPQLGDAGKRRLDRLGSIDELDIAAELTDHLQAKRHAVAIDPAGQGQRRVGDQGDAVGERQPVVVVPERSAFELGEVGLSP